MNRLFALVVLLLASAFALPAQLSTGTILGVVTDTSGAVVPGATVTVTNTSTNVTRTAATESDGSYRFDALQPGPYSVTVTKPGFNTSNLTSLTLEVAQELKADARLQVGEVTQQVTVSAESTPQVNVTTSSLGGLVNDQQVADLPLNGRNFIDLALLQPGVSNAQANSPTLLKANYFSTHGAPIRANLATLDGAPIINILGSTSNAVGTTLGVDGIQEFRVLSSVFGAQYGIGMGSQIVISSKPGTNNFHGDVFDYLRNDDLDSWGYFAVAKPKLVRNNFGGAFGGPIKKDKSFFWGVYEGIRQVQGVTNSINTFAANCNPNAPGNGGASSTLLGLTQGSNPCSTAPFTYQGVNYNCATCTVKSGAVNPQMIPFILLYPAPTPGQGVKNIENNNQPESVNYGQIRVDHTLSASDSMFGRFTIDKSDLRSPVSYAGTLFQSVGTHSTGSEQFDTFAENHIFSPTLLNTFRLSYARTLARNDPTFPAAFNSAPYQIVYNQAFGGMSVVAGLGAIATPGTSPQGFNQNVYTASDDINWNKGRHAIQIGTLLNRIEYYVYDAQSIRGAYTFTNVATFLAGTYQVLNDQVPGSNFHRALRFYTFGGYIQDDWRVNSRLTWNLGLRYEPDTSPHERNGANWAFRNLSDPSPTYGKVLKNTSFLDVEPRIGFAWDVKGDGKTAVRAAFGVYEDVNAAGQSFYGPSAGTPPTSAQPAFLNGTITGLPSITAAFALPPGTMPYGTAIKTSEYSIKQPRMLQWNVSIQRQITPSMSVTLAYVGTKGENLWDNEEGNPCFPSSVSSNGTPSWTSPFVIAPANILGPMTNPAGQLKNPLFGQPGYWGQGQTPYTSVVCKTVINPGTASAHFLTATYPSNASYPGTYIVSTSRNPLWGDWLLATTNGLSNYHGAELSMNKRISYGLEATISYTFSKVLDEAQGQYSISECAGSGGLPEQSLQPARRLVDYGPACFDVPQQLQASFIYHFPRTNGAGFVGRELLSGWWMGNKTTWQTGFPFSPTVNNWRSLDQNVTQNSGIDSEYVNYGVMTVAPGQVGADGTVNTTNATFVPYNKGSVIVNQKHTGFVQWFNPLMFTMNPIGQLGTVHKGVLRGPHYSVVDLSLNKDTKLPLLGEGGQLEFRIETFNLFNHTNLAIPSGYHTFTGNLTDVGIYSEAPVSTAGQITSTVGNPRQVQLSLKLIF